MKLLTKFKKLVKVKSSKTNCGIGKRGFKMSQGKSSKEQAIAKLMMDLNLSRWGAETTFRLLQNRWGVGEEEMCRRLEGVSHEDVLAAIWEDSGPVIVRSEEE